MAGAFDTTAADPFRLPPRRRPCRCDARRAPAGRGVGSGDPFTLIALGELTVDSGPTGAIIATEPLYSGDDEACRRVQTLLVLAVLLMLALGRLLGMISSPAYYPATLTARARIWCKHPGLEVVAEVGPCWSSWIWCRRR